MKRRAVRSIVLIGVVLMWLESAPAQSCPGDFNEDYQVTVDEILKAVNNALSGCPVPGARFVDNGDGTITDAMTRLTWEKKDDSGGIHDKDNTYTLSTGDVSRVDGTAYTVFLATLNQDSFAGWGDWRLPTISELQSIVDYREFDPASAPAFNADCRTSEMGNPGCTLATCSCTAPCTYWSPSAYVNLPKHAWNIYFVDGSLGVSSETEGFCIRAVRSY